MKKIIKLVRIIIIFYLTSCGGGTVDGVTYGYGVGEQITYITFGGLKWSSPSKKTYIYLQPWAGALEHAAAYCSNTTSINDGPYLPRNFNQETGWRIPTQEEITGLRAANPSPTNWSMVDIWIEAYPTTSLFKVLPRYFSFGRGAVNWVSETAVAHVVCVKPI